MAQATMRDDDIVDVPSPPRLVNDFAGMMSASEVSSLEKKLVDYNDSTSTQIAIVTVPTLGPYPVEEYGIRLARKWKIGTEKNNGILILVAEQERKFDIETGYDIGQYISDIDANRILRDIMTPNFKGGNYYRGLDQATDRMIMLLEGGYVASADEGFMDKYGTIIIIIVFILLLIIISKNNHGNDGETYTSTGRHYRRAYQPPIFGSGTGGFGGSSGGGFGGFGGGGFGGGGASGGW